MKYLIARVLGLPVLVTGLMLGGVWVDRVLAQSESVEEQVDALRCWRRIDRSTVRVGELLGMTVTCRVIATDDARAVPDTVGLEPETIDLLPFEVTEGRRFADIQDGPRLFFQYQYSLRLVGESYFGRDLLIPAIELNYRIERRFDDGRIQPGRELIYVLPPQSVRVLSLVPAETGELQGLASNSFVDAEQRGLGADVAMFAATGLGLVAVAVFVVGLIRAGRIYSGRHDAVARPVSDFTVTHVALIRLIRVRNETDENGWTPGQIQEGLALLRLAAAVALECPVAERMAGALNKLKDGELYVRSGALRRKTRIISSSVTATAVTVAIKQSADEVGFESKKMTELRCLENALEQFTIARYTEGVDNSAEKLTGCINEVIDVLRTLRFRAFPPVRQGILAIEMLQALWRDQWK